MKSIQYFNFQNSLSALNFYEKHLGATNINRLGGDDKMFDDMPDDYQIDKDFTMHASFEILGETFYCSDTWKNKSIDNTGLLLHLLLTLQILPIKNVLKNFSIEQLLVVVK